MGLRSKRQNYPLVGMKLPEKCTKPCFLVYPLYCDMGRKQCFHNKCVPVNLKIIIIFWSNSVSSLTCRFLTVHLPYLMCSNLLYGWCDYKNHFWKPRGITFQNLIWSDILHFSLQYDLICDNSILLSIAQSCFWIGMLASLLVGGFISDRFGRKIVWYCGGDIVLLATWIMIFPRSFAVFIVCRVFIGIGTGTAYINWSVNKTGPLLLPAPLLMSCGPFYKHWLLRKLYLTSPCQTYGESEALMTNSYLDSIIIFFSIKS